MMQEAVAFRQVWLALEKVEKTFKRRSWSFIQTINKMKKEEREGEDLPSHVNLLQMIFTKLF